uniref:Myb-like domain-containing protein n=2 Tax=Triticum urartu TaxID=4572 RepID=A0A8R7UZH5_TRIUA
MSSVRLILQRGCTAAEDAYLERLAREKGFGNSSMSRFGRGGRSMSTMRLRLRLLWTAEEDARLERLARENGFRHWSRVARRMPGRSRSLCLARWRHLSAEREVCYLHTALAALSHRDEDELLSRDWMRRWTAYRKKAAKSSPEKAQEYWTEFMKNAATGFLEEGVQSGSEPAS